MRWSTDVHRKKNRLIVLWSWRCDVFPNNFTMFPLSAVDGCVATNQSSKLYSQFKVIPFSSLMCTSGYRFPQLKSRFWQDNTQVSISVVINWLLWLLSHWSSQPHSQASFLIYSFHSTWSVSVGGCAQRTAEELTPQQCICFWGSGSPIFFLFFCSIS